MIKISPSILSSDFSRLGEEIKALENAGADMIHIDVMDGHYVPNLTFGPPVIKSLRAHTTLPFDVHLMITNPDESVEAFANAGADMITFHPSVEYHPYKTIEKIKSFGKKAGIAINPSDDVDILMPFLKVIDLVLVMTVNPGFGGQKFIESQLDKVASIKEIIQKNDLDIQISVDGGVAKDTAPLCIGAGADILVAGSAVFSSNDYAKNISSLKGY